MSLKSELLNQSRMYELLCSPDGTRYLDVVCGGVGMVTRRIKLTQKQVNQYRDEGESYLDDIAYKIGKGKLSDQLVEEK